MTTQLIQQVAEIRSQAAALRERAERLLSELRNLSDITPPPPVEEKISKNGRRIILQLR